MTMLAAEGQDIAQQMYSLLRALDRTPPQDAVASLRSRAEALHARCRTLLESEAAREEATAALARSLKGIARPLDELCSRLARGDSARAAFTTFRTCAAPRYEAFVTRLRAMRVEAPSLRPRNMARSTFHTLSALVAVLCIVLAPWVVVQGIAVSFFVFSWTLEIGRRYSESLRGLSMKLFGRFIHPHEHVRVNSATWYASALVIIAFTFSPMACALGVAALGFGDPAAAWVGRRWGRTRLRAARSLQGTIAFVAVTFAVTGLLLFLVPSDLSFGVKLGLAAVASVTGAVAELFSGRIDDNFAIPTVVAAMTTLTLWLAA